MGGAHDKLIVRLLGDADNLAQRLRDFDAADARCFDPNDQHKLMAVIEASFGTFSPFNKVVRDVFVKHLEVSADAVTPFSATHAGAAPPLRTVPSMRTAFAQQGKVSPLPP